MIWLNGIVDGTKIFGWYVLPAFALGTLSIIMITKRINVVKTLLQGAFLFYLCCVAALVFLPLPTMEEAKELVYQAELMPMHCIAEAIENPFHGTLVIVFNVLMTIPFGMFLSYYFKLDVKRVFLYGLALSALIEFGQFSGLFFLFKGSYRLFEVDDLIMNTLGSMIGWMLIQKTQRFLPELEGLEIMIGRKKPVIAKRANA